jgi:hypothetical protein
MKSGLYVRISDIFFFLKKLKKQVRISDIFFLKKLKKKFNPPGIPNTL